MTIRHDRNQDADTPQTSAAKAQGCAHPQRCGSDGESCCHQDCAFHDPNSETRALWAAIRDLREQVRRVAA